MGITTARARLTLMGAVSTVVLLAGCGWRGGRTVVVEPVGDTWVSIDGRGFPSLDGATADEIFAPIVAEVREVVGAVNVPGLAAGDRAYRSCSATSCVTDLVLGDDWVRLTVLPEALADAEAAGGRLAEAYVARVAASA